MILNFFTALFIAYGLVFVAELGDKTQLIILTLAMKGYSSKKLALGAVLGFAVIVFVGALISLLLSTFIDVFILSVLSGIFFIIIGLIQIVTLIRNSNNKDKDESDTTEKNSRSAFLMGFLSIVTMEMGDKTQIMTIVLASTSVSFSGTLIGSWLALSSLALIGAFSGDWLTKKISKEILDWIGAILFFVIGILVLIGAIIG